MKPLGSPGVPSPGIASDLHWYALHAVTFFRPLPSKL